MKSTRLYLLLVGALFFSLLSCNHPQSTLIDDGSQQVVDENILEITFALPNVGPTEGGMTIAIVGRYFHAGTEIYLDNVLCGNIQVISSGYMQCIIPAHVAAVVDIRVFDPVSNLTATVVNGFTYSTAPFLTMVSPNLGSAQGGTSVRLYGFNFVAGATVDFALTPGVAVTFVNSRQIDCDTPPGAVGPVDVTLTNPDLQTSVMSAGFTYTYPPPEVFSITPNTGDNMGGTDVTILGDWFLQGATVRIGPNSASNVVLVDVNTITCTTPPGVVYSPAQAEDVTVTNPDSLSGVLTPGFTYFYVNPAPTILTITPTSGFSVGGEPVTIDGTGFFGAPTVTFALATATNMVVVNSTRITCLTPGGGIGTVNVTVTNPDTQSDTLINGYTYIGGGGGGGTPGAIISSYTPDTAVGCDWWYLDFIGYNVSYTAALTLAGLHTGGASAQVDSLAHDHFGGQILETTSVAYLRNSNGTGISGTSYNITFFGDPTHLTGLVLGTHYSRMCYGNLDPGASGALGRAIVDPTPTANPHYMEDNDYGGSPGLGIFVGAMVNAYGTLPGGALTATDLTYLDGTYVYGTGNDTRYNQIRNYIQQLGMRIGFVHAHENGHSVGLQHYNASHCIMNSSLNISGNFTNTTYYFATTTRAIINTYLGLTPIYARESQTVAAVSQDAVAVVRAVVTDRDPFGDMGCSRLTVAPTQVIKGTVAGSVSVMVESPWENLPDAGEEVLLFLAQPDTTALPDLAGLYTLVGGNAGFISLNPYRNPQAAEVFHSAALYADIETTTAQRVARLLSDFRQGWPLAADAVVALSRIEDCGEHMSLADKALLIDGFASPAFRATLPQDDLTNFVVLLGRLGDNRAVLPLISFLSDTASGGQERNIAEALARIDGPAAAAVLKATLPGEETGLLVRKLGVLGFMRATSAYDRVAAYVASTDPRIRRAAIVAAGKTGSDPAAVLLRDILDSVDSTSMEKELAVVSLSFLQDKKGIQALVDAETSHADEAVRDFVRSFRKNAAHYRFALAGE
jgi:hypothetical protein